MTWQTPVFLAVAGLAFGYSLYRFSILFKLMAAHQGAAPDRLNFFAQRLDSLLFNVIGQKAVLKKRGIGIAHTMIFWGFIIISIGTVEQFLTTIHKDFTFEFLGEGPFGALVFIQDIFTLIVLLGVLYAAYRRLVLKPKHLDLTRDAMFVLTFTASLMLSIFLMNAFHILGHAPWFASHMPLSNGLAQLFGTFVTSGSEFAQVASLVFKWIHMLLVMAFSAYIPTSKHLHIVAAGPNTFLKPMAPDNGREKGMTSINFEDENNTQYGAAKITDLSWKDALDYYSCTECGRCQEVCPAWNTEKPLSPKKLIHDLKMQVFDNRDAILAKKYDDVKPIIDSQVTEDVIWACTSCRACETACPVFIEHTDKIFSIRRNLVMMESKFPAEVQGVFKNMETNGTPWAFAASDRGNWAEGLEIKTMAEANAADIEVLLWVGCAGSYDDRNKKVARSFVNILKNAQVKFAILGTEEQCTGDAARRIGNEYLFQTLAKANIETLNRYSVRSIVTSCPHCFNTLKNEYKEFGGDYEVFHHSQYISKLIFEGRIKPKNQLNSEVVFHDSCYLGRWNGVYAQPRETIESIPGTKLVEMKSNHDQSMCCGAGGGRMWMEEHIGRRVNVTRTEQALATGAPIIASACPFCMTMMEDGVKAKDKVTTVKVMDIAELVSQSLT